MKQLVIFAAVVVLAAAAMADTFGSGANQFTIDFVTISGSTSPTSDYGIVNKDYRIGVYEITNDQWTKFINVDDTIIGIQLPGFSQSSYFTGTNVPTNAVSWYESLYFVNWLNTSTGHHAAYNLTGTGLWDAEDAAEGTQLFRHKDAFYFLPTEDEWVKAAYWNGTSLQTWATVGDVAPTQSGWNYSDDYADLRDPWDVGSGSVELNGTYDMMGNVAEWMETYNGLRLGSDVVVRGGSLDYLNMSSFRYDMPPYSEYPGLGFRVASVPEPCTLVLLGLGGVLMRKRCF